jgi:hypothetical protein
MVVLFRLGPLRTFQSRHVGFRAQIAEGLRGLFHCLFVSHIVPSALVQVVQEKLAIALANFRHNHATDMDLAGLFSFLVLVNVHFHELTKRSVTLGFTKISTSSSAHDIIRTRVFIHWVQAFALRSPVVVVVDWGPRYIHRRRRKADQTLIRFLGFICPSRCSARDVGAVVLRLGGLSLGVHRECLLSSKTRRDCKSQKSIRYRSCCKPTMSWLRVDYLAYFLNRTLFRSKNV